MGTITKQYTLEGLCCGNCAAKIKNDISLLSGVKSADVNTETALLSVEIESGLNPDVLSEEITRIAVTHDEDIIVKEALA